MNSKDLKNYSNWIGKSPAFIISCVKSAGGWGSVFPSNEEFPVWASRVRNYFNVTPLRLKRLSRSAGNFYQQCYERFDITTDIPAALALSDDVYIDNNAFVWFEMSAGGTVYHYKDSISPGKLKALKATYQGQKHVPVFKLVSPDVSGGSREVCIKNYQSNFSIITALNFTTPLTSGESSIGNVGEWTYVSGHIENNPIFQGTYNYSETIRRGFSAHEHRDVKPHSTMQGFYLNPPDLSSSLYCRRFPERDKQGSSIA